MQQSAYLENLFLFFFFTSFLTFSLIPFTKKLAPLRDLTNFGMILLKSLFENISFFFLIAVCVADPAAINPDGTKVHFP